VTRVRARVRVRVRVRVSGYSGSTAVPCAVQTPAWSCVSSSRLNVA